MSIGMSVWGIPARELVALSKDAEKAGLDMLWIGEHLLLPAGYGTPHPTVGASAADDKPVIDLETHLVDPMVWLGSAAAVTSSLRLGTAIYLLALRHPIATARAAISAQQVAEGRFEMGVGVGWLREEFEALGMPFDRRFSLFEECLSVVRSLCRGGPVSFEGRFFSFTDVQVTPQPVEVPLILGGNSDNALKRAVALGDGWMSSGLPTFDESLLLKQRIERVLEESGAGRPFKLYFRIRGSEPSEVRRYYDAGMEHLVLFCDDVFHDRPVSAAFEILSGLVTATAQT